jgi:hypothetical protein
LQKTSDTIKRAWRSWLVRGNRKPATSKPDYRRSKEALMT